MCLLLKATENHVDGVCLLLKGERGEGGCCFGGVNLFCKLPLQHNVKMERKVMLTVSAVRLVTVQHKHVCHNTLQVMALGTNQCR